MKRPDFNHRLATMIIAYLDIFLNISQVALCAFIVASILVHSRGVSGPYQPIEDFFSNLFAFLMIFLLALCTFQLYVAFGLLTATQIDTPIHEAKTEAIYWRTLKVILITSDVIFCLLIGVLFRDIWSFLRIALRISLVLVVHWFIVELEEQLVGGVGGA